MTIEIAHNDPGVPLTTRNPTEAADGEMTVDGGSSADAGTPVDAGAPAAPADAGSPATPSDAGAAAPAQAAQAAPVAPPACECELASGPSYTPTGAIPVTTAGGRMSANFDLAASFVNNPAQNKLPSCCHVQQYIKWDSRFATWRGGPPHAGFGAAPADTWIEDRDTSDGRYGRRSGPHSQPLPNCADEYKTGARRDMLNGDTYCGKDNPGGPASIPGPGGAPSPRVGNYKFQLVVFKTGGTAVARSSVITVTWG
jgi:hypothetical protein